MTDMLPTSRKVYFKLNLFLLFSLVTFYFKFSLVDVHSPILCFLAGEDIDIDADIPKNIPNARERAKIVVDNPVAAAKYAHNNIFLNLYF